MKELGKNLVSITNHQTIEFYGILRPAILLFHKILELKKKNFIGRIYKFVFDLVKKKLYERYQISSAIYVAIVNLRSLEDISKLVALAIVFGVLKPFLLKPFE